MKKIFVSLLVLWAGFWYIDVFAAAAEQSPQPDPTISKGILPKPEGEGTCPSPEDLAKGLEGEGAALDIGTKIKCGVVRLSDVPQVIVYWIEWILLFAGTLCVIMIMVGGVQYMIGGITDQKEQGKNTVKYALIGLVVALFAWVIVDLIQTQITG